MDEELDFDTPEGLEFIQMVEETIEMIKNEDIEGEYFEF